jgi:hypothetical protein
MRGWPGHIVLSSPVRSPTVELGRDVLRRMARISELGFRAWNSAGNQARALRRRSLSRSPGSVARSPRRPALVPARAGLEAGLNSEFHPFSDEMSVGALQPRCGCQ